MEELAGEPTPHAPAAQLIDRRGRLRLAYEPIADLARGAICGFEAIERFPEALTPERWREEAVRRGLEADWDAFVVGSVLHARESLPPDCFLAFNLRAATLLREPVRRALAHAGRLDGLVIELAPRIARRDEARLVAAAAELRDAGALFALDGVGGEDAVLRHAMLMRPEFVKLGPPLVAGVHGDDVRRVLLDAIGRLASRFDAWVVAQGVADVKDLDALLRLGVPLAQGSLIGVQAKTLTPVAFGLSAYARERGAAMRTPSALATLVEPVEPVEQGREADAARGEDPESSWIPVVDAQRRPVGLIERGAAARVGPAGSELLVVAPASTPTEVARRAMLRPRRHRFAPLVCCDARGRYLGLVRIERLVESLADAAERAHDAP